MLLSKFYKMFFFCGAVVEVYEFGQYGEVSYYTGKIWETPDFLLESVVRSVIPLDIGVLGIGVEIREDEE